MPSTKIRLEKIKILVPGIKFVQGLPDDTLNSSNPETRSLYVICIDEFMGEKDGVISKLFTKKSHHGNLSLHGRPSVLWVA